MSLSGQVALVTGGGTGIGKAIAQAMHKEGAKIIIVGRKEEILKEAQAEIAAANSETISELPIYIEPIDNPTGLELKTYNISYYANNEDALDGITTTITYKATSMKSAEGKFLEDFPDQAGNYRETHSPLSNYAVDNEKIVETQNNNDTTNNSNTTTNTIPTIPMKKFNILNAFKIVNEYVYLLTMLIVAIIPLLLLGVVLFGDNFFLGNVVVYNIQNILDSMGGFVGIITLILIVTVFHKFHKKS